VLNLSFQYKKSPLINLNQAFNQNPVNFTDPLGLDTDAGRIASSLSKYYESKRSKNSGPSWFDRLLGNIFVTGFQVIRDVDNIDMGHFTKRLLYETGNLFTLGTLEKTAAQKDLDIGDKIWFFLNEMPDRMKNAVMFGLPDNVKESGPGFGGFIDAVEKTYYDLTPIGEIKAVFSDSPIDQKFRAFGFGMLKVAGYGLAAQPIKLKMYTNYRLRHLFNKTITLETEQVFYTFKNKQYFTSGTEFGQLELWMTPDLLTAETAVNKLALPYSNYDLILKVTMPKGSKILKPRRVWKLFGREGGGLETRNISPIKSTMYELIESKGTK
jgi:hypothetical protein